MQFHTVRDLRTSPKAVWESLGKGEVIITNNGRPSALMLDISKVDFEETLMLLRQTRAIMAVRSMRETAVAAGYMTDAEINAEIDAVRKEMRDAGRA